MLVHQFRMEEFSYLSQSALNMESHNDRHGCTCTCIFEIAIAVFVLRRILTPEKQPGEYNNRGSIYSWVKNVGIAMSSVVN